MGRGLGSYQRQILDELRLHVAGSGVLVGDGGPGMRRAAHSLARRELVALDVRLVLGRHRLVARLSPMVANKKT